MKTILLLSIIQILFLLLIVKYLKQLKVLTLFCYICTARYCTMRLLILGRKISEIAEVLRNKFIRLDGENKFNLTPRKDADESGMYLNLIKEKLSDPDVRNIALTGPYGSGKSSILKTFQNNYTEFGFLNISLASFQELGDNNGKSAAAETTSANSNEPLKSPSGRSKKTASKVQSDAVEYSILQQIFYHVKHQKIPFSRFKRIKNLPSHVLVFKALSLVAWIGTITYLIYHDEIFEAKTSWDDYFKLPLDWFSMLLFSYGVFGAVYIIYLILRVYNNSRFHKLNLTSGELEISPENELSILNKHMDELIYFFEATKFDVLVLEDLDRFNDPEIFTHLRELNTVINNSQQITRKITFIYALRDDVFKNEKRTKFFDYIIPIIPIVDNKNSAEKMMEMLLERGISQAEIPRKFLEEIAIYVQDMRLIINTLNEFDVYRLRLGSSKEGYIHLLAIMFYKNKCPKMFTQLQRYKGAAYEILNGRERFLSDLSSDFEDRKTEKMDKLDEANGIFFTDLSELNSIYLAKILTKMPTNARSLVVGSDNLEFSALMDVDIFQTFIAAENLMCVRSNGIAAPIGKFSDLEKEVNPKKTYSQRRLELERKNEYVGGQLQRELDTINDDLDSLRKLSLREILRKKSLEQLAPDLTVHPFFNFLVSNGYITEDYHYYLSYFYPGSLSKVDIDFLFAIKENRFLAFDYLLENVDELMKRLQLWNFNLPNILNNHLLERLLIDDRYTEQLGLLLEVLSDGSDRSKEFISQFLRVSDKKAALIKRVGSNWKDLWNWINIEAKISEELKFYYLELILRNCELQDLIELDSQGNIRRYLEQMPDFFDWAEQQLGSDRTIRLMERLDLSFTSIEKLDPRSRTFNFLYNYHHYAFNPHMIALVALSKDPGIDKTQLENAILTTIGNSSKLTVMYTHIMNNLNIFILEVFLKLQTNTKESEETVISLINNSLDDDMLKLIFQQCEVRVSDIGLVETRQWDLVLLESFVKPVWSNVYKVFEETGEITEELAFFINIEKNNSMLYYEPLKANLTGDENAINKFALELMLSPHITNEALDWLLESYEMYFSDAGLEKVEREKMEVILKHDRFFFNSTIFAKIQRNFAGLQKIYVEKNVGAFFEKFEELTLESFDYELLLASEVLKDEELDRLLGHLDAELLNGQVKLCNLVAKLLLKPDLGKEIGFGVLLQVFTEILDLDIKVDLMNVYLTRLTDFEITDLMLQMGEKFKEIVSYNRPRMLYTKSLSTLVDRLAERKLYVSSSDIKNDKLIVYTRQRPK